MAYVDTASERSTQSAHSAAESDVSHAPSTRSAQSTRIPATPSQSFCEDFESTAVRGAAFLLQEEMFNCYNHFAPDWLHLLMKFTEVHELTYLDGVKSDETLYWIHSTQTSLQQAVHNNNLLDRYFFKSVAMTIRNDDSGIKLSEQ
eukprot:3439376-Amphidinium_carterae.1